MQKTEPAVADDVLEEGLRRAAAGFRAATTNDERLLAAGHQALLIVKHYIATNPTIRREALAVPAAALAEAAILAAEGEQPDLLFDRVEPVGRPPDNSTTPCWATCMTAIDLQRDAGVALREAVDHVAAELRVAQWPITRKQLLSWRRNAVKAKPMAQDVRRRMRAKCPPVSVSGARHTGRSAHDPRDGEQNGASAC